MATDPIPDYEVRVFLDEVAPNASNTKIANMLGVHRNTIARYLDEGMPVAQARLLLALRIAELTQERQIHETKAAELMQESQRFSEMMDQYKL